MNRHFDRFRILLCAVAALGLLVQPAHAVQQGDCDDDDEVKINEVQRCANIFLEMQPLSTCPPCDLNGSNAVEMNEIQGAANCYLDSTSTGCQMLPTGET